MSGARCRASRRPDQLDEVLRARSARAGIGVVAGRRPRAAPRRAPSRGRSTTRPPTIRCASTCARWARCRCSRARARSRSRSASRRGQHAPACAPCSARRSACARCSRWPTSCARARSSSRPMVDGLDDEVEAASHSRPRSAAATFFARARARCKRLEAEAAQAARARSRTRAPATTRASACAPRSPSCYDRWSTLLRETRFSSARHRRDRRCGSRRARTELRRLARARAQADPAVRLSPERVPRAGAPLDAPQPARPSEALDAPARQPGSTSQQLVAAARRARARPTPASSRPSRA